MNENSQRELTLKIIREIKDRIIVQRHDSTSEKFIDNNKLNELITLLTALDYYIDIYDINNADNIPVVFKFITEKLMGDLEEL